MQNWKKWLSTLLAVVMLVSMVPAVAAEKTEDQQSANEVIYNLQSQEITVVTALPEEGTAEGAYVLFDEEGNYTIPLEDNAFFPYEVQFTCDGEIWSEWFMDADDSVEIGGHTFYVTSAQTDPEQLCQIGVWIGDEYVPAFPEAKTFINGNKKSILSTQSLILPTLTASIDLTSYLPGELKTVPVSAILSAANISGNVAVWTKYGYYDEDGNYVSMNDEYIVLGSDTTLDLSMEDPYLYWNDVEVEMIVGTVDQLNTDNRLYRIRIDLLDSNDLANFFTFSVPEPAQVHHTNYGGSYVPDNRDYIAPGLDIYIDNATWNGNDELNVSFTLSDWFNHKINRNGDVTVKVFNDAVKTEEETQLLEEITGMLYGVDVPGYPMNLESEHRRMALTVIFYRDDQLVDVCPMVVEINRGYDGVSTYPNLLVKNGNRFNTVSGYSGYERDPATGVSIMTGRMWYSTYPVNGMYYFRANYLKNNTVVETSELGQYVKKAVVGYYSSANAAMNDQLPDVKDALFNDGYEADYSKGVIFTIVLADDSLDHIGYKVLPYEESDELREPDPMSEDTYFEVRDVTKEEGYYNTAKMRYDYDSYYYNGYQTIFLLNGDGTPVTDTNITPVFFTGNKVNVYAGLDVDGKQTGAQKQISGETSIPFVSGNVVQYSAAAEDGDHLKNYWVTFVTQSTGGAKLYVNAVNDKSHYDETDNLPVREIFLTEQFDHHHDVFFANIGDAALTGLYARLENAENIALDPYWTIGTTNSLAAFTQTYNMQNIGKVRLVLKDDGTGTPLGGEISGTLVIGSTATGEEVKIKLTGIAGEPKITTTSVAPGVRYIPYSSVIQTNNMYATDAVKFSYTGSLPDGMILKPNGELYGVPTATGEYKFTVTAACTVGDYTVSDSADFTLNIAENTAEKVEAATDEGYTLLDRVADMNKYENQVFRSLGMFDQFVDFWMDGRKLTEGVDYDAEEGSTKITIRAQTFQNAGSGTHTLAAEFRTGGRDDLNSDLKRAAQNYVSSVSSGSGVSHRNSYSVQVATTTNGTVRVEPQHAAEGEAVVVTVTPAAGYELDVLTVVDTAGNEIPVTKLEQGQYRFEMPKNNVTISASFIENGLPFVDVSVRAWYFDCVKYMYENDLMVGTTTTMFEPDIMTTRGMIVTILYRMAGEPETVGNHTFTDVAADNYYSDAIQWAVEKDIISGYGDGRFGSEDNVTREQLVTLLFNYAKAMGCDVSKRTELRRFTDADTVSAYALDAMRWACAESLVYGREGNRLDPTANATRAEVSAIFARFSEME